MSPDRFIKVFDVVDAGFRDWSFSAFGLIFVVVGAGIVLFPSMMRAVKIPYFEFELGGRKAGFFFLAFALLWTSGSFWLTYSQHLRHAELAAQNQCSIVEGRVQNFVPMPYAGHADESFSVSGVSSATPISRSPTPSTTPPRMAARSMPIPMSASAMTRRTTPFSGSRSAASKAR